MDQGELGREVGLIPSDIVLDVDAAPLPHKVAEPPNFWPMSIVTWPNGWMDQDETWHAGRPISVVANWLAGSRFQDATW